MTLAAVDRLVHHATIFEINVDSHRRRAAIERKHKGPGRPADPRDSQGHRRYVAARQSKPNLILASDNHTQHHRFVAVISSYLD
jgi:hypothetical protein